MSDKPDPETYYAGAYWGPRKESAEECARRTAHFLTLLAPADPSLAQWYKPARRLKDARKHPLMPPDLPTLTECFRRGVNRERGGPVFEDLGLSFWFGTGEGADLRITCGDYAGSSPNHCVLDLPDRGSNADRVLTTPVLTHVVRSMAVAWEPDWAVAMSRDYRETFAEPRRGGTFVGWVTYLSRRRGVVPPLPAPARIELVEDRGTLLVLTPERLTASNPAHVESGQRVRELLDRAGLMQPVIPK
ncbi:immunity 52 family protein [Pyxidicoccus sp. MSG2]|uniref:immunity 52 family protein n=1 Tax=Pyxidicoccus sp. MSG2 TaxID=2996790 RepID=UPI00226D7D23|nr:immunity 52 family protein [Pyxidicoccus sp. MSG2]MCY1022958.1 immunity 52 family protein [Pyxidicoccus sp. MSG2]